MSSKSAATEAQNGWTAVPVDPAKILHGKEYVHAPEPLDISDIPWPKSDVVDKIHQICKDKLPEKVYNHSMRVYYYCYAITTQQFRTTISLDTLALASLLHDIGATPANMHSTRMSFDLYGGILALNMINELGGDKDQAEAVSETVIRHQDLGTEGNITLLGQVIQLATLYDNIGAHPGIIHEKTRESVNDKFSRQGWLGCFAETVEEEMRIKPWCHSTHVKDFAKTIRGCEYWKQYG